MPQLDEDLKKSVETALNAFENFKTDFGDIKTKFNTIAPKLDAFDKAKIDSMADDIGKAAEASQKATARAEAIEAKQTELEAENEKLRTAFNRAPAADSKEAETLLRKNINKAFNNFARVDIGRQGIYFDEFLQDPRFKDKTEGLDVKALSVMGEPSGGYTVLPQITGPMEQFIYESSPMRSLATTTTIGTDNLDVLIDNDQPTSGWVGEADARTATNTPVFQKVSIPVNELYANAAATQKILDDSIIDIESWLTQKIADRFGRDEATGFVTGNGVNQPKGIMSYTSGTDTTAKQIEQVVTGDASNFTYDGLVNLQAKLKEPYQANATFLTQRFSIANIMLIKDGIGRPMFNMFPGTTGNNAGLEITLMGRPLRFAADIASISSNALAMAYGDFRRAYQIVDRAGIRILRDPFTSKPNVIFYVTKRVGGGVVNFEAVKIGKIST